MTNFPAKLALLLACALSSCAAERTLFGGPAGYEVRPADEPGPAGAVAIAKIKAKTVTLQIGTGNTASSTDNTKAGQKQGSAATAPRAASSNASEKSSGSPWLLNLMLVLGGALLGDWLASKLPASWLRWLPWRAAPP
ncbi:hypothetical protein Q5H92_21920 [Hymenobacter sp. M29]|uniref:Uncharacterized protein n=1 Tax=Hymenobacter mellowenesis TaxID=3063995 RepID=A0ABT9AGP3_9BACT|nr:hypothetical protein [Hymenobacter sp. M29]MDO7849038.1 hypothetical protein [Hymenobacter sp. M29]